jgi:geranylgeranyl pyrophosphate synthase
LPALDDDDLRRGRPTAHVKFGEDLAILSADILHTQAFSIVTHQLPKHYPAERVIGVLKLMTEAFGLEGVIGGEIIDVKNGATNLAELREMHRLKTGELIRCACLVPAYLENCSESDRHHIDQFASHLGVLFQIVDDLLDHTGSAEELGKTPGKDQIQNKLTYVSLLGLEGAKSEARAERGLALEYLKALKKDTGILEEFVDYIFSRTN